MTFLFTAFVVLVVLSLPFADLSPPFLLTSHCLITGHVHPVARPPRHRRAWRDSGLHRRPERFGERSHNTCRRVSSARLPLCFRCLSVPKKADGRTPGITFHRLSVCFRRLSVPLKWCLSFPQQATSCTINHRGPTAEELHTGALPRHNPKSTYQPLKTTLSIHLLNPSFLRDVCC